MLALITLACIWTVAGWHLPNSGFVDVASGPDNVEAHNQNSVYEIDGMPNNKHA